MNENMRKRNEALAQTVIKGLQSRNMTGHYAENKEEALKKGTGADTGRKHHRHGRLYERP